MARLGACDIGAFESQGFTLTKSSGDSQSTPVNAAFPDPLVLTVTANHVGEPVNGGMVSFTAPATGVSAGITGSPAAITGGQASVTATANDLMGPYNVNANTSGATSSVDFRLQNTCAGSSLTVSNTNDDGSGSLRRAVANICPGGTIDFAANTTIHLASALEIDKDMTIDGTGFAVTISGDTDNDGASNVRRIQCRWVFQFEQSDRVRGYDNTFYNSGTLNITNCTFFNKLQPQLRRRLCQLCRP